MTYYNTVSSTVEACCGNEELPKVPDIKARRRRGSKSVQLPDLKNPIPEEIRDTDELQSMLYKYKLVPFAGLDTKTGHSLLLWYMMLAKLSTTHGSVIEKLKTYTIGGRPTIEQRLDPDFNTGEERREVSTAEKIAYRDRLNEIVTWGGLTLKEATERIFKQYKDTGNSFVDMAISTVNGQSRVDIKVRPVYECIYKLTKPGQPKMVAISPVWTNQYLEKNPPEIVPLYPNTVNIEGVQRTILHLKNGGNWYGRPDSEHGDLFKYREVQDALYIIKQAAANFVGQLILEVEEDNLVSNPVIDDKGAQEQGFDSFADKFEDSFTQKGENPRSVVIASRPFGAKPMFAFQVAPNTNEAWYKVTDKITESKITTAHGVTLRFMGKDVSNGFSQDAFVSDYVMNVEPTINALSHKVVGFLNTVLNAAWALTGNDDMMQYSIEFENPIKSQVERYKNGDVSNPARGGEIQPGRTGLPDRRDM